MEELIFTKYSNERSRRFAIRTDILEEDGQRFVRKTALYPEGKAHVAGLTDWYQGLTRLYKVIPFSCNKCEWEENRVRLEYVEGRTLEEELDGLLKRGRTEEASAKLTQYLKDVRSVYTGSAFTRTEMFSRVFGEPGEAEVLEGLESASITNIDMVSANLVMTEPPTVLDYEWTFDFPVPREFVLYRIIHYYIDTHSLRQVLDADVFYREFGITEELKACFEEMEANFQKYITGEHIPMREMFAKMTPGVGTVQMVSGGQLQVFFSKGEGYREEESLSFPMEDGYGKYRIEVPAGCVSIRIDPGDQPCAVHVEDLSFDGQKVSVKRGVTEKGCVVRDWAYIAKGDPNISEIPVPAGAKELTIAMRIYASPQELMEQVRDQMQSLEAERQQLMQKVQHQSQVIKEMRNTKIWRLYQKYRNMAERKK